ncbi:DC-STAMP domain-containing protein 2 [Scleropages formosus]|nr:DC-STAMP domain-containing protein 2 [Scleropages formosus]
MPPRDRAADESSRGSRDSGRGRPRRRRTPPAKEAARSLGAFMFGLFLASLYGGTALFVQNYSLRFSLVTTILLAAFCAFGMGLSLRLRSTVLLMLPMLCSKSGKNFLLFLIFSLVVQGPLANTLKNFDRAAASMACGAELTMNQTQQLMNRAVAPVLSVLSKMKQITRNAYSLSGRVETFMSSLTQSVRHVARVLRNVLYFMVNIGEVCNNQLGTPYQKCSRVFTDAYNNCKELLNIFAPLCDIVDVFRPLCDLAKVLQVFCIIPSYIADQIKAKIAEPTITAFEKMREEFEFNISASVHADVQLNSSHSIQEISQQIMNEVTMEVSHVQEMLGLLSYVSLFLLLLMYLQAVLYKEKFLNQDDFDNIYITDQLVEMDLKRCRQGRISLLPLNEKEAITYICPCSLYLTDKERQATALSGLSILRHIAVGGLVVALDLVVFWMFDIVYYLVQGDIVARAPLSVVVQVNGSGYALDIFKDLLSSFDILQKSNITVISKKCVMKPFEPDYILYMFIGLLYGLSLFIAVAGSYIMRFRRFVCASYYPEREKERICVLYNHILIQRESLRKALLKSVARRRADWEQSSPLRALTICLPEGSRIARFFIASGVSCMACGLAAESKDSPNIFTCSTPHCTGLYCLPCYKSIGSVCAVCMGPLAFQEDAEEEIDSSDDQQLDLWTAALKTMTHTGQDKCKKKLLKRRIREALRRRPDSPDDKNLQLCNRRIRQESTSSDSDTDSNISVQSSTDTSEPSMTYQEHPAWENSESSDHDPYTFLEVCRRREKEIQIEGSDSSCSLESNTSSESGHLHVVMVHSPMTQEPSAKALQVQTARDTAASSGGSRLLDSCPAPLEIEMVSINCISE